MLKKIFGTLVMATVVCAFAATASANKHEKKDMHHCMKDGKAHADAKDEAACKAAGGTWESGDHKAHK